MSVSTPGSRSGLVVAGVGVALRLEIGRLFGGLLLQGDVTRLRVLGLWGAHGASLPQPCAARPARDGELRRSTQLDCAPQVGGMRRR